MTGVDLAAIPSPVVLAGDRYTAYRDPLLHYHDGRFRLFFSEVLLPGDGSKTFHVGLVESDDLVQWTEPRPVTPPADPHNFCGPGGIVRHGDRWVMCLSSYPQPNAEDARCWTMASDDLDHWDEPQVLHLKGPAIAMEDTGRCLDPYIVRDKDQPERWWCLYKQGGLLLQRAHSLAFGGKAVPPDAQLLQSLNLSYSYDLAHWVPFAVSDAEENYCVVVDGDDYVLVHSPGNGIGIKRSKDLISWYDECLYTLGQRQWPWSQGRLTAGHLLDLRDVPAIGRYLLTFHGATRYGRATTGWHGEASVGIAWSDDLRRWFWPSA